MIMALELGLFFFVLLGSKVVLGVVAVYMLLPQDPCCEICNAELLPIVHPRGFSRVMRWLRLQRRWCMECQRESLGRAAQLRVRPQRAPLPVPRQRVR